MFSKEEAIKKLNEQLSQITTLTSGSRKSPQFKKWIRDTQVALEYIFGKESRHISDFNNIRYFRSVISSKTTDAEFHEAFVSGLQNAEAVLNSMIEEISEYWESSQEGGVCELKPDSDVSLPTNNKIFVIHGHDSGTKETVARFLGNIGLDPIILHEQASQGNTIIEKFEEFADVAYAVALLTPDDIGSSVADQDNPQSRARQNVIFEFGYFIGKLGRKHVAGLTKGDVEMPSDYSGVLYISLDDGGAWRFLLVKELKAIGFDVDANKAL